MSRGRRGHRRHHPGGLALSVVLEFVDEIVLVTEEEPRRTMVLALTEVGQVLEGAGAATLSALETLSDRLEDKVVVALLSGGNAESEQLYDGLLERRQTLKAPNEKQGLS